MSTKPDYPPNVTAFVNKWKPVESDSRRKAFWKEFRKAANAYNQPAKENPSSPSDAADCPALDACKLAVSQELMSAINGSDKTARTEDGFIRWGLVEKRMHEIIERYWPNIKSK